DGRHARRGVRGSELERAVAAQLAAGPDAAPGAVAPRAGTAFHLGAGAALRLLEARSAPPDHGREGELRAGAAQLPGAARAPDRGVVARRHPGAGPRAPAPGGRGEGAAARGAGPAPGKLAHRGADPRRGVA